MAQLRWTHEAEQWLHDIFDYLALDNPDAAASVIQGIYDKAQNLRDFPDIGYRYRTEGEGEIRTKLTTAPMLAPVEYAPAVPFRRLPSLERQA